MTRQHKQGFTLIELLLYISLSAVMLFATTQFLFVLVETRIKNQTIAEVDQQGIMVLQSIMQAVRDAEGIIAPATTTDGIFLSLMTSDPNTNPTIFDEVEGVMRITEGSEDPVPLTNERVTVSDLTFSNPARAGTRGMIRIEFTLAHKNEGERNEYSFTETFVASASVRP
jgi:Tfp pilus assembly protein PilW